MKLVGTLNGSIDKSSVTIVAMVDENGDLIVPLTSGTATGMFLPLTGGTLTGDLTMSGTNIQMTNPTQNWQISIINGQLNFNTI